MADEVLVRTTMAAWEAHGPALVRACPVTRVELTDRRPTLEAGAAKWVFISPRPGAAVSYFTWGQPGSPPPPAGDDYGDAAGHPFIVARGIVEGDDRPDARLDVTYPDVKAAEDDLSGRLVRWARSRA